MRRLRASQISRLHFSRSGPVAAFHEEARLGLGAGVSQEEPAALLANGGFGLAGQGHDVVEGFERDFFAHGARW